MPGAALGAQSSLARAQRAACHVRPCTRAEEPPGLMHGLTERQVLLSCVFRRT
uniref:Putative membrane protein n=1 Tax=Sorangium cellulosum So0157-2 TaxID=1254432 RepID=A0A0G2YCS7_SORCE|nr:putative membrane protein [Sorangium cellulosum So0157-2]